ncbi:MAG: MFS transporter [Bacillota bacterium]
MRHRQRFGLRRILDDLRGRSSGRLSERNIRLNIYHGVLNMTALNMVQPFIPIFAMKLAASDAQVALLSSAPAVVSLLAMIPGGKYADTKPLKKRFTAVFFLLHRFFWLTMALIPLFTRDLRPAMLVAIVALMNLPGAIGNVAWQGFIGGVVPRDRRADAFAARNRAMNIAGTAIVLVIGRILDAIPFPLGYQVVFCAAFLVAVGEVWVFSRIEEQPGDQCKPVGTIRFLREFGSSLLADIRQMGETHRWLRYTTASIFFHFAWQAPWPLFSIYQFRVLGANNLWISILSLTNAGGSLFGYGFWARYMNRHGPFKTLFVSSLGIFVVPLAYAFSTNLQMIATVNLFSGAIFSGVGLALFNALLEVSPEQQRTTYIAYYSTLVNVATIFAPLAGVALSNQVGIKTAFLAAASLRMLGSLTFYLVSRQEAREQPPLVEQLGASGSGQ